MLYIILCSPPPASRRCSWTNLLLLLNGSRPLGAGLLLALALLEQSLGDQDVVLGGDGTVGARLVRSPAYHCEIVWDGAPVENCCSSGILTVAGSVVILIGEIASRCTGLETRLTFPSIAVVVSNPTSAAPLIRQHLGWRGTREIFCTWQHGTRCALYASVFQEAARPVQVDGTCFGDERRHRARGFQSQHPAQMSLKLQGTRPKPALDSMKRRARKCSAGRRDLVPCLLRSMESHSRPLAPMRETVERGDGADAQ